MKEIKNVLSLFNGMSGAKIGLDIAGINVDKYYSSEIDKYANKVTNELYPDTINLGDITKWQDWDIEQPDLIIGGSPCSDLSFSGKQKGLSTQCNIDITTLEQYQKLKSEGFVFEGQSYLFWEFIAIREHYKPKYFILENVMFAKKWRDVFNKTIGFESDVINSALVSAQSRKRQYWGGILNDDGSYSKIDISQPEDRGILLKDIVESDGQDKSYYAGQHLQSGIKDGQLNPNYKSQANTIHSKDEKSGTICAGTHGYANGYIEDKIICGALRGRYRDDGTTEQKLEVRKDKNTNTVTTVQKDNVIVSAKNKNPEINGDYLQFDPNGKGNKSLGNRVKLPDSKHKSLSGTSGGNKHGIVIDKEEFTYRKLTPRECLRLQTVPEHIIDKMLTSGVSNTQLYRMCGNGYTCEVIAHILKHLK